MHSQKVSVCLRALDFEANSLCTFADFFWSPDQWVDGKFLPKGTVLFVNVYGLHQDESKFPHPNTFDPDHYKGRTLLAAEYANSADYENRDHYGFGSFIEDFSCPFMICFSR